MSAGLPLQGERELRAQERKENVRKTFLDKELSLRHFPWKRMLVNIRHSHRGRTSHSFVFLF